MSSPDSELVVPEITEESSVSELMKFVRSSFRREDFQEVERLLVGGEEKMEMELRNLKRDYEEMNKECQLLEAQNLELEEKLKKRRIECQEFRQQLVGLEIEKREADDQLMDFSSRVFNLEQAVARLLRVPVAVITGGSILAQERTRVQLSANGVDLPVFDDRNRGMNIENLQNGSLQNGNLQKGNLQNGNLQKGNLQNGNLQNGAVNHVDSRNGDFDLENLHKKLGINFENGQTLESFLNSQLQFTRFITGTQCPDLPKEETAASDHGNNEAASGAQLTSDCAEVDNVASDQEKENSGSPDTDFDGELLQSNMRAMNGHDVVLCSTDVQAACDAPEAGTNSIYLEKENKTLLAAALTNRDTGCDNQMSVPKQLVIETDSSNQAAASCISVSEAPGSPIVIEISDSDEENLPAGSAHFFTSCASDVNSTGKKMPLINIGKDSCFAKAEEEDGTDTMEDSDVYLMPKRKRSMTETSDTNFMVGRRKKEENGQLLCDEKGSLGSDSSVKLDCKSTGLEPLLPSVQSHLGEVRRGGIVQIGLKKSLFDDTDNSSDCTSSDSENESCLEAYVDKMVAIAKGCRLKKWNFAADMLSDLEEDDELCMNAVCALYRKKNFAEKSPVKSSLLADPDFSYTDAMSVTQLAEFLIDGDPQCKLKRTVSDVQQKDPEVLSKCKDLANRYFEKLFELYQKGQDPFFHPKF